MHTVQKQYENLWCWTAIYWAVWVKTFNPIVSVWLFKCSLIFYNEKQTLLELAVEYEDFNCREFKFTYN